jgi:hypothetical protein
MPTENEEVKPEVEVDAAPVLPAPPIEVAPVVTPVVAPKPPAAPKAVRTRPTMMTPIIPVLAGSIPQPAAPGAPTPQVIAISGPQRLVVDVTRKPAEQLFHGLKIEAKFIDGLPGVVISKGGGHKPITILAPERPQHRFVIEY